MPEEGLGVIHPLVECFPVVLRYVEFHLVAVPVVDDEPRHVPGVELHVRGAEGDADAADGLGAVPRHEDPAMPRVGENVVAVIIWVVEELVDGRLLDGVRLADQEL